MMSTACLLTRSVGKTLAITTTLALLALAYTGPAFALEATIGDRPVTCERSQGAPSHMSFRCRHAQSREPCRRASSS